MGKIKPSLIVLSVRARMWGFFPLGAGCFQSGGGAEKVTGEYSSLDVGVVQTSIINDLCLPRTSLRTETSIVDLFSYYRGVNPSFELRQTRTNTRRIKEEEPTKNISSHGNKRPQVPRRLKSDLKLPDRHFSTFKARKVPPWWVSPVDKGHGCL